MSNFLAQNPNARNVEVIETVEAGIELLGTEIKSIRGSGIELRDAFVDLRPTRRAFEAYALHLHIAPYKHGNRFNHEPDRPRRLLLHIHQLRSLYGSVNQKGMTLIILKAYFKRGRLKVLLGLGRGKKIYDRRDQLLRDVHRRELRQEEER